MNRGPWIFLGAFAALAASFYGLVLRPQLDLGRLVENKAMGSDDLYPVARPGTAAQGAEVYRANGCAVCHSQQVRPMPADLERFGRRRSVAPDYLFDQPAQLGRQRIGPDLANIGARHRGAEWQLQHLFAPRSVVPGSTMPAYPYLFQQRRINGAPAPDAVKLPEKFAPPSGYEIVPTRQALALVSYLDSLRADAVSLFEAPLPASPTNAPATNAPVAGVTNLIQGATNRPNLSAP
jgi:cytochrome c oxidase cbb3-type subunit II